MSNFCLCRKGLYLVVLIAAMLAAACTEQSDEGDTDYYVVDYDKNNATGGTVPQDSKEYREGDSVTVLGNTGGLVRTGFFFAGWNTVSDGSGLTYTQGQTFVMGKQNVKLFAKWSTNPVYSVIYDGNDASGGTVPSEAVYYEKGALVTVLGNTGSLVRTGYHFTGWNTAFDGSGLTYTQGQTFVMGEQNVQLYAVWVPNPVFTISYDANGASGTAPSDTVKYEEGQTATVMGLTGLLEMTGYAFTGWNTVSDGSGTPYLSGAAMSMPAGNVTLYAQWSPFAFAGAAAAVANSWDSLAYGNGTFVALSFSTSTNQVMTSADGASWTARDAGAATVWNSVTYGDGLFVAVAAGTGARVMTSADNGINWTAYGGVTSTTWRSVTYGNGLFVAVSQATSTTPVMTSADGENWTAQTAPSNGWYDVAYGNGLFVAVGTSGGDYVMTSPDGVAWTTRTIPEANSWRSVAYGNGLFVAVASDGTNRVMTSLDGITWTARPAAEDNSWFSLAFGNGLFVATAVNGTNRVMTSPDGVSWSAHAAAQLNSWYATAYGNGHFVAVASDGTTRTMNAAW